MKRKGILFLGLAGFACALCGGLATRNAVVFAEPEPMISSEPESFEEIVSSEEMISSEIIASEPVESNPVVSEEPTITSDEEYECYVTIETYAHGEIVADRLEGHVGDIVNLTIDHDLFYMVGYIKLNGTNLIEDEYTSDLYTFALVEGENKIEAKFVVDQELLGEMSIIYEQASNKDWTKLFSVENVIRIVAFLLNGGILIAMIRYFIKDKKIAKNVENSVTKTVSKVLPETTKQLVLDNTKEVLQPMFTAISGYQEEIIRVVGVLVKCVALMQEDTPDSRRAILAELTNLNIGDTKVIEDAKAFIDKYFKEKIENFNSVLNSLDNVIEKNKAIVGKIEDNAELKEKGEDNSIPEIEDNGIQI